MRGSFIERLGRDLEAPIEARGFGTGWFSGFFGLLLALAGLSFVAALRWPDLFAMPELDLLRGWGGECCFRIHGKARRETAWREIAVYATQRRDLDSRWPAPFWGARASS